MTATLKVIGREGSNTAGDVVPFMGAAAHITVVSVDDRPPELMHAHAVPEAMTPDQCAQGESLNLKSKAPKS